MLAVNNSSQARGEWLNSAIQAVDEYMTKDTEDSIFDEPALIERYNQDINGFLKWEQLGKDGTPRLRSLIAAYQKMMGRVAVGGQPSQRAVITQAIYG